MAKASVEQAIAQMEREVMSLLDEAGKLPIQNPKLASAVKELARLAKELKFGAAGLQPGDVMLLNDILRDEVRWGTRGTLSDYHPEVMTATFDHMGDAKKFRRLVQRAGFTVSDVKEEDVTEFEGMDYVVEIRDLR